MKDEPPPRLSWLLPAGFAAVIVLTYGFILATASSKNSTAPPSAAPSARVSSAPATATGLDLVGAVKDSAGQAITNATIFIYTAQPRSGPGFLWPSCYADCRKSAKADAQGNFKIDSVDPTLLFRVLVVAKGFEPAFFTKVDPGKGTLDARLKARAARTMPVSQIVTGRVLAPDKKPVAKAVVSVEETVTGNTMCWGVRNDKWKLLPIEAGHVNNVKLIKGSVKGS